MTPPRNQHLLIDADDTLWENHAYFIVVHQEFLDLMESKGLDRGHVDHVLREIEAERTQTRGYGSTNYALSLVETVEAVNGGVDQPMRDRLLGRGHWIHDHPIEVFPGVAKTLEILSTRHEIIMVTKGNQTEQESKIARSGLAHLFAEVEILSEKSVEHYHDLAERHGLSEGTAWMIGNSPKSDINPARTAGLRTVHIPHKTLWEFEFEELHAAPDITLERFQDLLEHF